MRIGNLADVRSRRFARFGAAQEIPPPAATAFMDDFTGDGQLGARSGWTFMFGNQATGVTTGGALAMVNTAESGWSAPDTGSVNHYAQAQLVNVGTNGPLLCVSVIDIDNWLGLRNSASAYSILKKVAGTVTVVATVNGLTPALSDIMRFEERGRDLAVLINSVSVWSGTLPAGELEGATKVGVVGRTATRSPWIDNWQSDVLA